MNNVRFQLPAICIKFIFQTCVTYYSAWMDGKKLPPMASHLKMSRARIVTATRPNCLCNWHRFPACISSVTNICLRYHVQDHWSCWCRKCSSAGVYSDFVVVAITMLTELKLQHSSLEQCRSISFCFVFTGGGWSRFGY